MKKLIKYLSIVMLGVATSTSAQSAGAGLRVAGFNLTEDGALVYDAAAPGGAQTEAQKRVLESQKLGTNHIILNVRATMTGGRSSEITPVTPAGDRKNEAQRMVRLIKFIKSLGMTVGLRPIFFVVGPNGEFPYTENLSGGGKKLWWHGNIQPDDVNRWFETFRVFLDQYILVAKASGADEFTIGAELYSMTVGIEDQWKAYPYGFPGRWLELLRYVRAKLPQARLMYDVNFTDDSVNSGGLQKAGGEIERWRYRLVDLANPRKPEEALIWKDLVAFWTELDAVGIDMYRSLGNKNETFPNSMPELTNKLKARSDSYANQLDTILNEISLTLSVDKIAIFKEVGFRSVERGFIDPFTYAGGGKYNELHQAAALKALFESFWRPNYSWFGGISLWDIPLNPEKKGTKDPGFSPIDKPLSEEVVKSYFGN